MNDTPRTDEAQFGTGRVSVEFARTLERQLNSANAEVDRLTAKVAQLYEGAEEQKQRIKRLEEMYEKEIGENDKFIGTNLQALLTRELNAANERIKRLEEALDLVRPHCSFVHHSKKHQHAYDEPCPVVALIEKAKEAKP